MDEEDWTSEYCVRIGVGQVRAQGGAAGDSRRAHSAPASIICCRARHTLLLPHTWRTNVVQSGQSAGMMRIRGRYADDFHNLFHSFCEDPAIARR
jgi:hypothetical protein